MLLFRFRKEKVGVGFLLRPRLPVQLLTPVGNIRVFGLLDSGADRTIVPSSIAEYIGMKRGKPIQTFGIGGVGEGFESAVSLQLSDENGTTEALPGAPAFVLYDFDDVIIGRAGVFDSFKITFDRPKNKIIFEKS